MGGFSGFVTMCVDHIPSAKLAAPTKVTHTYTGPQDDSELVQSMLNCDPDVRIIFIWAVIQIVDHYALFGPEFSYIKGFRRN